MLNLSCRFCAVAVLLAASNVCPVNAAGPLRADSNLILVNASVLDKTDRFVNGLAAGNFRVFDDGVEQKITSVALEDVPISLGLVIDASNSMTPVIPLAQQAIRELLDTSNPADDYFLVKVHNCPRVALDFTPKRRSVLNSIGSTSPRGRTALFDAVFLAADHARRGRNPRKALLVITDGKDNNSRYSRRELLRFLSESGVTVYTIGLNIHTPTPDGRIPHEAELLEQIADETGGRYLEVETPDDLPAAIRKLDIRYQYVLAYRPPDLKLDGRYHNVKLKLEHATGTRAYWRPGYYATAISRD